MSLILDALNKAQREREERREPVPQLTTVHATPTAPTHGRPGWLLPTGIVVVLLVVAGFAGGIWLGSGPSTANSPLTGQIVRQPAVAADTPAAATELARQQAQVQQPEPVAAPDQAQELADSAAATIPQAQTPDGSVADLYETSRVSAALEAPATESHSAPVEETPEPEASQSSPAESSPPPSKPAPQQPAQQESLASRDSIPYVQDLSWSVQQELPSLIYNGHQYGSVPSSRVVELNGTPYRAGSQIAQGLVLEEILRDGIVMRYQGQRFKLDALNSWVNF